MGEEGGRERFENKKIFRCNSFGAAFEARISRQILFRGKDLGANLSVQFFWGSFRGKDFGANLFSRQGFRGKSFGAILLGQLSRQGFRGKSYFEARI